MTGGLSYDSLVEDALRSVVGRALTFVAEHGLPGDHHLYITFRTEHGGVVMPAFLRERYPAEMTIVLQHQFWGLDVGRDAFAVTLSFNDQPQRLTVPYDAVLSFADPSVRFGLQFDVARKAELEAEAREVGPVETSNVLETAIPAVEDSGPNVVPLDTFRKKS